MDLTFLNWYNGVYPGNVLSLAAIEIFLPCLSFATFLIYKSSLPISVLAVSSSLANISIRSLDTSISYNNNTSPNLHIQPVTMKLLLFTSLLLSLITSS